MDVLVYSTRPYDRDFLAPALAPAHAPTFVEAPLTAQTARLAHDYPAVCCFVDDCLDATVLEALAAGQTRFIALRCTGFNNVDLAAADRLGLDVRRVARYSPHAVAEFAVGLMLALNRKIHRAYNRVREGNFLLDGLLGFDLHGKTVGVVGAGQIGSVLVRILIGFGCRVLIYDPVKQDELETLGAQYVALDTLLGEADIVSLHTPLTPETHHLINAETLARMRAGAMLINTGRGALVDANALIGALKSGHLGAVGMDVYEEEEALYFRDLSEQIISDDTFARLLTFPNVLVTGHQAFFTREALGVIAGTTRQNLDDVAAGRDNANRLHAPAGMG